MERIIFHIDVNSAFLSWEAAKRVKNGEADIRLIPSAIGGDRDKRTGVVLAKSIPAKKFGISKSTVHMDVSSRLKKVNPYLYKEVRKVLDVNKEERHIRGGLATKEKYLHQK